jgi:hypothetical protein
MLVPGALIVAHNTVSSPYEMSSFIARLYSPSYESITILTDPAGMTLSVKLS